MPSVQVRDILDSLRGFYGRLAERELKSTYNQLGGQIVSIIRYPREADAIFSAAIARTRPFWDNVPMLDVQHMYVEGSLKRCIRFLVHTRLPVSAPIYHVYLGNAASLRPDWSLNKPVMPPAAWESKVQVGKSGKLMGCNNEVRSSPEIG